MNDIHNEKRILAHDIIKELFEAKQQGHIELLLMWCQLSLKELNPVAHEKWIRSSLETIEANKK